MNYNLNALGPGRKTSTFKALRSLLQLIRHERRNLLVAFGAILLNSGMNLLAPFLIGYTIDHYVQHKDYPGVLRFTGILGVMYLIALGASYFQTKMMGGVGQRMLFTLRNAIFTKLQELPVGFFNANKAGDLISRVNNDSDKINTFFSQSLMQFVSSIAVMTGAGIFLLLINWKLGAATLVPGVLIVLFTWLMSPLVKRKNAVNLKSIGGMSAEIQESLQNFKVVIAFNRRDYFRQRFDTVNRRSYRTAISAGLINNIFLPVYSLFSSLAQLVVLAYGIYLIAQGEFTIGLLVSYLVYANNFYNPLRQLAALWTSFQVAMGSWDRIDQILQLQNNLPLVPAGKQLASESVIEFRNVSFGYEEGREILHNINLRMEKGRSYALVGPTGGGKTTTASLIARLYDPTQGTILLDGRDLRSYPDEERTRKIGFILQEPFLFSGTVRENILYGNPAYQGHGPEALEQVIRDAGLERLLSLFDKGLETPVTGSGEGISLGQKQLIAFMRAVLRNPEVLILDEATANIDTVTEHLLQEILEKLSRTTTRIIIAHRLNTIENADEIFFVNAGEVIRAGSFDDAVNKLLKGKRVS